MIKVFYWPFIVQFALFVVRIDRSVKLFTDFFLVILLGLIIVIYRETINLEIGWLRTASNVLIVFFILGDIILLVFVLKQGDFKVGKKV